MKTNKFLTLFFLFASAYLLKAQVIEGNFRFDTRLYASSPKTIANKAFRNTFDGVYGIGISQNVHVFKNFYVGLTGSNSLYYIPTSKGVAVNGYKLGQLMQMNSVGFNVGYDYYFSPKGFLSSSVTLGQLYGKFTNLEFVKVVSVKDKFTTTTFQITENVNFILEDHMAIGFFLSYARLNHSFNPYDIALEQFKAYSKKDLEGATSYLEIGFNLYFGYVNKKK